MAVRTRQKNRAACAAPLPAQVSNQFFHRLEAYATSRLLGFASDDYGIQKRTLLDRSFQSSPVSLYSIVAEAWHRGVGPEFEGMAVLIDKTNIPVLLSLGLSRAHRFTDDEPPREWLLVNNIHV